MMYCTHESFNFQVSKAVLQFTLFIFLSCSSSDIQTIKPGKGLYTVHSKIFITFLISQFSVLQFGILAPVFVTCYTRSGIVRSHGQQATDWSKHLVSGIRVLHFGGFVNRHLVSQPGFHTFEVCFLNELLLFN